MGGNFKIPNFTSFEKKSLQNSAYFLAFLLERYNFYIHMGGLWVKQGFHFFPKKEIKAKPCAILEIIVVFFNILA